MKILVLEDDKLFNDTLEDFLEEEGFDLLKQLREAGDTTPTIFLTSRADKDSLTQGFDVGTDDYMKKPIDLDELLLRINALLRRQIRSETMQLGEYQLDMRSKELSFRGKVLKLGAKSIDLLLLLVEKKGEVVSLNEIAEHLWHTNEEASAGAIRVYVTILKKYFQNIENIRGIGYRLKI